MFLTLRDVTKRFGDIVAVDQVALDVREGEFVCFLGPSGCGKTTLLRLIAGLEIADAGEIVLEGRNLASVPARLRNFGVVFQSYSLFPNMTVEKNVAYGLECRKWRGEAIKKRLKEMLRLVRLEDQAHKYPEQLSGGQQQRVALARALAPEPAVLLLDEPLSALDAKVRENLRGEIRDLQKTLGITTIMVTHDQDEAMEMADRIVVMDSGRIAQAGSASELYNNPANRFVAEFIGRMNILRLDPDGGSGPSLAGMPIRIKNFQVDGAPGQPILVGVRPEEISLCRDDGSQENRVSGMVERSVFLGNVTRVTLSIGDQQLMVELHGNPPGLHRGAPVTVSLPPAALRMLHER